MDLVAASVRGDAAAKRAQRQEHHELRENKLAFVHGGLLREDAKDHKSWSRLSNLDQTERPKFKVNH